MTHAKKTCIVLMVSVLLSLPVFSHPHTFMRTRIEIAISDTRFEGFWIDWEFDPMFTSSILQYYDFDKNNVFSETEAEEVYQEAFNNLEHYNYFTRVFMQGKEHPISQVSEFTPYIENNLLHYRFFVPFPLDLNGSTQDKPMEISIALFDETYFCAIDYHKTDPVVISVTHQAKADYSIRKNVHRKIEYTTNDATAALGITYPDEIVLKMWRTE